MSEPKLRQALSPENVAPAPGSEWRCEICHYAVTVSGSDSGIEYGHDPRCPRASETAPAKTDRQLDEAAAERYREHDRQQEVVADD